MTMLRPIPHRVHGPCLAALAGLPATQVPITVDAQGMPMGVQLIGGWLQDLKTLEIARQMAD